MKVVLTIVAAPIALVLAAPLLLLIGIALGPAALVILFIAGFAFVISGLLWLVQKANVRHNRVPPTHT
jgi:apolipoprotein N-acyltransferase